MLLHFQCFRHKSLIKLIRGTPIIDTIAFTIRHRSTTDLCFILEAPRRPQDASTSAKDSQDRPQDASKTARGVPQSARIRQPKIKKVFVFV